MYVIIITAIKCLEVMSCYSVHNGCREIMNKFLLTFAQIGRSPCCTSVDVCDSKVYDISEY